MSKLPEHVGQTIAARKFFSREQRLLVAVSGGVDSMVLLQLLHTLAPKHGWRLTVAHFNHQLRGRSSDADERLVRGVAAKLGWPFVSGRANVREFARAKKSSIEMAARQLRHEFFARTARRRKIKTIALAHHADDQVELFFLRLLRGSGGEGLAGMKWMGTSPVDSTIKLVRPLLDVSKAELEEFAREHKVHFREDASNASLDIQRNRIRAELLPLLRRKYQPVLSKTILRVMEIVGAESEFVAEAACPTRKPFARLAVAVQRKVLQRQLVEQGIAPEFDLIERLRGAANSPVTVSPGLRIWRNAAGLVQTDSEAAAHAARPPEGGTPSGKKVDLRRAGKVAFSGIKFFWKIERQIGAARPRPLANREFFDADRVGAKITLRHWRAGDRFQPSGMASPVKLQDLFVNAKIPRAQRAQLVVATTADGEVFWVQGLRIAERFKLTAQTVRRLEWSWRA